MTVDEALALFTRPERGVYVAHDWVQAEECADVLAAEVRRLREELRKEREVSCVECGSRMDRDDCEYTGDAETAEWLCHDCDNQLAAESGDV